MSGQKEGSKVSESDIAPVLTAVMEELLLWPPECEGSGKTKMLPP